MFNGPFPGLPGSAGTRDIKPVWISLKQETVSGSGISWAICKSAPRSRQITTPAPHHSVFRGRMLFLTPNQQRQSTDGPHITMLLNKTKPPRRGRGLRLETFASVPPNCSVYGVQSIVDGDAREHANPRVVQRDRVRPASPGDEVEQQQQQQRRRRRRSAVLPSGHHLPHHLHLGGVRLEVPRSDYQPQVRCLSLSRRLHLSCEPASCFIVIIIKK